MLQAGLETKCSRECGRTRTEDGQCERLGFLCGRHFEFSPREVFLGVVEQMRMKMTAGFLEREIGGFPTLTWRNPEL
jgi:hypothetical protein